MCCIDCFYIAYTKNTDNKHRRKHKIETQEAQHKQSNFSYSPKCQEKKMEKKAVYLQNKVVRTSLLHTDSGNHFRHCNTLLLHRDQVYSSSDLRIPGINNSMT